MGIEAFKKLEQEKQHAILQAGILEFSYKSFADARTDIITKNCGISKGSLFHYFGSKRDFYRYCLEVSFEHLLCDTPFPAAGDFYDIIFAFMNEKINLCLTYPKEMLFINMASRDTSAEISAIKIEIFQLYYGKISEKSSKILLLAIAALPISKEAIPKIEPAFRLYINAVMQSYLQRYQINPNGFFENIETIKTELKAYIDIMLYGILK